MDNKQGIIQAVEQCLRRNGCSRCENCPYTHVGDGFECREKLRDDIIALLKAQQPRVMTLEEIRDRGDDEPPFLEYNLSTISVLRPDIFQSDNSDEGGDGYMRVVSACCASGFYNRKEYGKTWRCWTSRPDEKVRSETPWVSDT